MDFESELNLIIKNITTGAPGKDYQTTPKMVSAKSMILLMTLSSYFIMSYYNTILISWMTTGPTETSIKTFQDVVDGNYQVSMLSLNPFLALNK